MIDMVIGVAAGVFIAVMSMVFYRKGVRDGMGMKKGTVPQSKPIFGNGGTGDADEQSELMRKYEMILNYDPYGERI